MSKKQIDSSWKIQRIAVSSLNERFDRFIDLLRWTDRHVTTAWHSPTITELRFVRRQNDAMTAKF